MDEEQISELLECSVCLEQFDQSCRVLPCQHTFCRRCLEEILVTKFQLRCPECRMLITTPVSELPTNIFVMRILERVKNQRHKTSYSSSDDAAKVHRGYSGSGSTPSHGLGLSPLHQTADDGGGTVAGGHHFTQNQSYAKALYTYESTEKEDLCFKKGDIIVLKRQIDENWFRGEMGAKIGFFPANFVQVVVPLPQVPQSKALYDFDLNDESEKDCLSFKKDDVITVIRRVDDNWLEGRLGDRIGIFPISFVQANDSARMLINSNSKANNSSISSPVTQSLPISSSSSSSPPLLPVPTSTAIAATPVVTTTTTTTDSVASVITTVINNSSDLSASAVDTTSPSLSSSSSSSSSFSTSVLSTNSVTTQGLSTTYVHNNTHNKNNNPSPQNNKRHSYASSSACSSPLPVVDSTLQRHSMDAIPDSFSLLPPIAMTTATTTIPATGGGPSSLRSSSHALGQSPPLPSPLSGGGPSSLRSSSHALGQSPPLPSPLSGGVPSSLRLSSHALGQSPPLPSPLSSLATADPHRYSSSSPSVSPTPLVPESLSDLQASVNPGGEGTSHSGSLAPPIYVALYNYHPIKDDELELHKGDHYNVVEKCQDGWCKGSCLKTGQAGVFPGNYVSLFRHSSAFKPMNPNIFNIRAKGPACANPSSPCASPSSPSASPSTNPSHAPPSIADSQRSLTPSAGDSSSPPPLMPRESRKTAPLPSSSSSSSSSSAAPNRLWSHLAPSAVTSPHRNKTWVSSHQQQHQSSATTSTISPPNVVISSSQNASSSSQLRLLISKDKDKKKKKDDKKRGGLFNLLKEKKSKLTTSSSGDGEHPSHPVVSSDGISHTRSGSYPCDDTSSSSSHHRRGLVIEHRKAASLDSTACVASPPPSIPEKPQARPLRSKYCCVVPYPPQMDYELGLEVGDVVHVLRKRGDGWYKGIHQRTGKTGMFPASFVEKWD